MRSAAEGGPDYVELPDPQPRERQYSGRHVELDLTPSQTITTRLLTGPGVTYTHGSRGYVLRLSADRGFVPKLIDPGSSDMRFLGASAELTFGRATEGRA